MLVKELSYSANQDLSSYDVRILEIYLKNTEKCQGRMDLLFNTTDIPKIDLQVKLADTTEPTSLDSKVRIKVLGKYANSFTITSKQYEKLNNRFTGKDNIDLWIATLLLRYRYYSFLKEGISLSIGTIYDFILETGYQDLSLECFAGSLNSNLQNYCSLFYDIEKNFSSLGNFFELEFPCKYQILVANPPFILESMNELSERLITTMDLCADNTVMFVNIPDWRSESELEPQSEILDTINVLPQKRSTEIYPAYTILRSSSYFAYLIVVGSYEYYNFFQDTKTPINQNVLIICLSKNLNNPIVDISRSYINTKLSV